MNTNENSHRSANEDLIVGARIISCGPAGVIENGFVQVADGQVTALGSMSELPPALAGQGTDSPGAPFCRASSTATSTSKGIGRWGP